MLLRAAGHFGCAEQQEMSHRKLEDGTASQSAGSSGDGAAAGAENVGTGDGGGGCGGKSGAVTGVGGEGAVVPAALPKEWGHSHATADAVAVERDCGRVDWL